MSTAHERVLVVDDGQGSCSEVADQLEFLKYQVTCAHSGEEALAALEQQPFDLILLDTKLPGVGSDEILRHVRLNQRHKELPVIVVSMDTDTTRIGQCIDQGADDYLVKPFAPALLQTRIRIVMERRRLEKEHNADCEKAQMLADALQEVILPVGIALSAETDFDRLLERILLEAKSTANTDAGALYLRTDDNRLEFAIVRTDSLNIALGGTTGNPITFPFLNMYLEDGQPNMHNVATYVALTGNSVKVADAYHTEDFDFSGTKRFDQQTGYRTKSMLAVPLKNNKKEVFGVLQLINSMDPVTKEIDEFDYYEQLVIETLASQAAVALNNQLVTRRQVELLKLERDVQVGHNIQSNFLPKNEELPHREGWEISTCLHPARQVAGDFYDAFEMTHGRIGFLIADVCDKGVGAALFMALMRSLTRAFAQQHYSADLVGILEGGANESRALDRDKNAELRALPSVGSLALEKGVKLTNDYVAINHGALGMFATMFFGVLNPSTGSILYINGGHNAPMIIDTTGHVKTRLMPTGPAVGMFAGADFAIEKTRLMPGETLFCFTDGVPDARNTENKLFTEKRLQELVSTPVTSSRGLLDHVEATLFAHISTAAQFDDITMLVLRRSETSENQDAL